MKRSPLRRTGSINRPSKNKGTRQRKAARARAREAKHFGPYATWIRLLPCAVCCGPWLPWKAIEQGWDGRQQATTAPAHVPYCGRGAHPEKLAKGSVVPLCQTHHGQQHTLGWITFQKRHNFDAQRLAEDCARRYEEFYPE